MAFEGQADLAQMPRLSEVLAGADGPASYRLEIGREGGRALVRGQVAMNMRLICQRCLGEVAVAVDEPIALAMVRSDAEARNLPEELDPLLVEEGSIRPLDLVEDELLLAVPLVPMHWPAVCRLAYLPGERDLEQEAPKKSPFAALRSLKRDPSD